MGACFKVPFRIANSWPHELQEVRAGGGYRLLALHLQGSVELDEALASATRAGAPPLGIMVGAEYEGVSDEAATLSDARVKIAMAPAMQVQSLHAVDSLNVNVAAAIVLERIFSLNRLAA